MKKKVYLAIAAFALLTLLLKGIPHVAAGISQRGIWNVNYGMVVFPLLVGAAALYLYYRQK